MAIKCSLLAWELGWVMLTGVVYDLYNCWHEAAETLYSIWQDATRAARQEAVIQDTKCNITELELNVHSQTLGGEEKYNWKLYTTKINAETSSAKRLVQRWCYVMA